MLSLAKDNHVWYNVTVRFTLRRSVMRYCSKCQSAALDELVLMSDEGYKINIAENGFFGSKVSKLKCSVCLSCGNVDFYADNIEKVKEADKKRRSKEQK